MSSGTFFRERAGSDLDRLVFNSRLAFAMNALGSPGNARDSPKRRERSSVFQQLNTIPHQVRGRQVRPSLQNHPAQRHCLPYAGKRGGMTDILTRHAAPSVWRNACSDIVANRAASRSLPIGASLAITFIAIDFITFWQSLSTLQNGFCLCRIVQF
jgi:hypothetical protein